MPNHTKRPSKLTTLGAPCARTWTNDWIAAVNAKETELNHRICGARLPDATPCTNASDHPSGRCQFHGGFDLTGAPPGNRNHVIHGLYSRRLRPCTPNCPYWESCPCANFNALQNPSAQSENPDSKNPQSAVRNPQSEPPHSEPLQTTDYRLQTSSIPQFPTCPYQLAEYNTVLTDALAIVESQPHPNPMGIHAAHNVAMLQVLVNAGAAQLAQAPSLWSSEDPNPQTPNPNTVIAFTRLMREFRANLKLLYTPAHSPLFRQNQNGAPPTAEGILRHADRAQHDTGFDPDSLADAQLPPQTPETHAKAYVQRATLAGGQGRDIEMCEAFDEAARIDEEFAKSERDHVLASYRPAKQSVSQELAERILGNLHLPPLPKNVENPNEFAHATPPSKGDQGGCSSPNSTSTDPINQGEIPLDAAKVLQDYLDTLRAGKVPPEAFPIGSPARAQAEAIYTGPSNTAETEA